MRISQMPPLAAILSKSVATERLGDTRAQGEHLVWRPLHTFWLRYDAHLHCTRQQTINSSSGSGYVNTWWCTLFNVADSLGTHNMP